MRMRKSEQFFLKKRILLWGIILFTMQGRNALAQLLGLPSLISINEVGDNVGNNGSANARVSADGRVVIFQSGASDLVHGDLNNTGDIFARNLETGETILVSATPGGQGGNARSRHPVVSADGRFVAFESLATDLLNDPNIQDVLDTWDLFPRFVQWNHGAC